MARTSVRALRPTMIGAIVAVALVCAGAATPAAFGARRTPVVDQADGPLLVLPLTDMTNEVLPQDQLRGELVSALDARGIRMVPQERMLAMLAAIRMRDASGLDDAAGKALRRETGAAMVLITSVDLFSAKDPPRMGIHARLVSIEGPPVRPVWAGQVQFAGEQAPGLLGAGVVTDPLEVRRRVFDQLADEVRDALIRARASAGKPKRPEAQRRFKPRSLFVSEETAQIGKAPLRVAVLPFANHSKRPFAGESLALHVTRELIETGLVRVIEPGRVRRVLLDTRVSQEPGISLPQAELLRDLVDADFVIAGTVYEYRDGGPGDPPQIEFSAYAIDARARKVAWIGRAADSGSEAVSFFEAGMVRTAPELAGEMVQAMLRRVIRKPDRANKGR